jgi:hypothetical protein
MFSPALSSTCAEPMLIRLVRPVLLLNVGLLLTIALIRAQPYHDAALRDLLTPPDCLTACLIGIYPGITKLDDAYLLLNAHPWVAIVGADYRQFIETSATSDLSQLRFVTGWQWARTVPDWIDRERPGTLGVAGNYVNAIGFHTGLPMGAVMLAYGLPDQVFSLSLANDAIGAYDIYRVFYPERCMWVEAASSLVAPNRYHWPAKLIFQAPDRENGQCQLETD